MKKLLLASFGLPCLLAMSSCDTVDYDDDDDEDDVRLRRTTRVTEETVRTNPYTGSVQRETTHTIY